MSTTLDFTPVLQPILDCAGIVIAGVIAIYVPRAVAAFEARTGIMLTTQQISVIKGFVDTSAGVLETKLDQGSVQLSHINISNPTVLREAQSIIDAAPVATSALGMTGAGIAKMIVASVDTGTRCTAPPAVVVTGTEAPIVSITTTGV
jgi:hypothetical protein